MEMHGGSKIKTDAEFLSQMTEHHQSALVMAKQVLTFTKDPGVKKLAQSIIKTQTGEIAVMASLAKGDDANLLRQVLTL